MTGQRRSMKTEAKKSYDCGFALAEGELRRLHDVLSQQIRRTRIEDEFQASYELKFRNGSVAYPSTLDEVLEQENFGSAAIVRLKMEVRDKTDEAANRISVEFVNADDDEEFNDSIRYGVLGEDRDWVFITSSQLDERIGKIKLFAPNQLFSRRRRFWISTLPMLLIMSLYLGALGSTTHRQHHKSLSELSGIENQWKAGAIKDQAEVTIGAARVIVDSSDLPSHGLIRITILTFVAVLAVPLFAYCYIYFQPSYNFLWGDYVAVYEKRRSSVLSLKFSYKTLRRSRGFGQPFYARQRALGRGCGVG